MKKISIKEIAEAVSGRLLYGDPDLEVSSITTDSREVPEEALFIPIKGENANGHRFLEGAVKNGALAVFSEEDALSEKLHESYPETAVIAVKDTTAALQDLARHVRFKMRMPAVGVTGSVGKTTTREMISTALSAGLKVFRTEKNFNNWLGLPTTLLSMSDDDDIAVLELGMNVPGELGLISSLTNLDAAVITNIGQAHMEFYGSKEKICREKMTVTRGFVRGDGKQKRLFLNAQDPLLVKFRDLTGFPYTLYGYKKNAEYRADNVRHENGKTVFDLYIRNKYRLTASLSVLGDFNVLNALAAFAVADYFHVDLDAAAVKLSEYTGFKGRLQQFFHKGIRIINDAYNASPVSMKGGLDVLESLEDVRGRKIAVLGDMLELGPKSPAFHEEVGTYAASKKIDALYLLGERALNIKAGAEAAGAVFEIRHFTDREELLKALKETLSDGDAVYLKASNGMKLSETAEGLLNL